MADNNANASDFRENNDDKDVVFLFAGHYWYPMYLSKDNSDNVILTLWHANMSDERCLEYAQEIGIGAKDQECYSESDYVSCTFYSDVGYANGCLYVPVYSQCNGRAGDLKFADFGMKADSYSSPSNLYSVWWAGNSTYTSLEELWWYGELEDGTTLIVLSASSQWTRNGKSSLTHLLVTPSSMAWQENQSAKKILGAPYNLSNESWSTSVSDDGFYSSNNNYASISGSSDWASIYYFLPSLSEIGYSGVSGLWGASDTQRACYDTGSHQIGYNAFQSYPTTWTRSANYKQSYGYYFIKSDGNGKGSGGFLALEFVDPVYT